MSSLNCSFGGLAPGIRGLGLEPIGPDRWTAWCEFAEGHVRHFEFVDSPCAEEWLSYVLMNQHGFEREAAASASRWLFESVAAVTEWSATVSPVLLPG